MAEIIASACIAFSFNKNAAHVVRVVACSEPKWNGPRVVAIRTSIRAAIA